jgi:Uma2 family endonuclease
MARSVRKVTTPRQEAPLRARVDVDEELDEETGISLLRWERGPDGQMEQVCLRLTPELFLNPRVGDQLSQGPRHFETVLKLFSILKVRFEADPDVLVAGDLKHIFGGGLPAPGPDLSVVRGVRVKDDADRYSFRVQREGVRPCLIIEVVSPLDPTIRDVDVVTKVDVYERAGVREYLIVDSTKADRRFRLVGHRLDAVGRYRPIEPDAAGRLYSETTDLWFQSSPDGEQVFVFDASGRRLLDFEEQPEEARREAEARKAAEEEVAREAEARKVAEEAAKAAQAEVARLRAEIERMQGER